MPPVQLAQLHAAAARREPERDADGRALRDPAGAVAVSANITVFNIIGAAGNGVFKVDTVSPPLVAWINYPPTEAQRGNAGVVALNGSGQIIVQVAQGAGQVDFVVDVNGYYTATGIVNSSMP